MEGADFIFLSEKEMTLMQQKARQMLLNLKEDVQWSKYCGESKRRIDDVSCKDEKSYCTSSESKDISVQVKLAESPSAMHRTRDDPSLKLVSHFPPAKPIKHSNILFENLEDIRERLFDLQRNVEQLKKHKKSDRNDENLRPLSNLMKEPKEADKLKIIQNLLKMNFMAKDENEPKQPSFQLPYVLKEQQALERRRSKPSWMKQKPKSDMRRIYSKPCSFKTSPSKIGTKTYDTRIKESKATKWVHLSSLDCIKNGNLKFATETVSKAVQTANDTSVENACLSVLESRLIEIEEKEKLLHDKWDVSSLPIFTKGTFVVSRSNVSKITEQCDEVSSYTGFKMKLNENCESMKIQTKGFDYNGDGKKTEYNKTKLYIGQNAIKSINTYKDRFSEFQHAIGDVHFSPWILTERVADTILDECFEDVAAEMNNISSSLVMDIYKQEFRQT